MCGILGIVGSVPETLIKPGLNAISHRGPDVSTTKKIDNVTLGFNRLIVNGKGLYADQPFDDSENLWCICNGEIFNHHELEVELNYNPVTGSDCEILIPAFKAYSFPTFCNKLDAEFSLIIYDKLSKSIWIARDPYGVRPLFWGEVAAPGHGYAFASELKALLDICVPSSCEQFNPGFFMRISTNTSAVQEYTSYNNGISFSGFKYTSIDYASSRVNHLLSDAVRKRLMCENGGVCCLLSGGLDSSLVAALATKFSDKPIHTFAIGMKGSTDLGYAEDVARYIGSNHHSICLSQVDFLDAIPVVIRAIESYDVTTVRASVGNYLIGKYIRENTKFKVVLNGDYSDEVTGGYLYMKNAPTTQEFHDECKRLVQNIHYFDSLRSDRSICAHGLEARAPFADKKFVEFYLSLDPSIASPKNEIEKYLLRYAFKYDNLLPSNVLWRKKEAFSDGVSAVENSWHVIARKHAISLGYASEETFYKETFDCIFGYNARHVIPYKWMPKYCNTDDPSARTLLPTATRR